MNKQAVNEKAIQAMAQFLDALGVDIKALGMEKTPYRVAEAFGQFFSGLTENPDAEWENPIRTQTNGLVAVRNIRFHSMCALFWNGPYCVLSQAWVHCRIWTFCAGC